jgi:hypothetical protein
VDKYLLLVQAVAIHAPLATLARMEKSPRFVLQEVTAKVRTLV